MFLQESREAILHAERTVLAGKAAFNRADEILNIGKSAFAEPFLITTLLSVRLPLFAGMRVKLWSNCSNEPAHQVIAGTLDLALITGVPAKGMYLHVDNPSCLSYLYGPPAFGEGSSGGPSH